MTEELSKYYQLMEERPDQFRSSDLIPIETREDKILAYEQETGKKIGVVYQSPYNILVVDLIKTNDGGYYTYERLLPTVKRGAVVAFTKYQNKFVLLRQYRHSMQDFQYAVPRGFGEEGISAEDNVEKELKEELGAKVISKELLGNIVADSGMSGSVVSVFLCEVESIDEKYGYEGIESLVVLEEAELEKWIRQGRITDGFTLTAYGLYRARS